MSRHVRIATQGAQPIAHTCHQLHQSLVKLLKHLPCILISTCAHLYGLVFSLLEQPCALRIDRLQQPALTKYLLHPRLRLRNQPLLLLDNAPRPLLFLGDSDPHPIDDVQDALFVHQQPTTEWYPPTLGQRILHLVDQIVQFDGRHPLCAYFWRNAATTCGGTNSTGSRPRLAISRAALELTYPYFILAAKSTTSISGSSDWLI